jgi:hypothetical protein
MSELAFRLRGLTERQVDEHRPDRTLRASTRLVVSTVAIVAIVYSDQIHKAVAVVDHTGVSLLQAKQAVQLAERTNAHGVFILKEGIDKARALKGASGADVAAAAHIVSIQFNRVGGATVAVISPPVAGVSILYTVSGTDTYYDSKTLQTDASGSVSFAIPRARPGVRDTISASAVLSGRTAGTTFVW